MDLRRLDPGSLPAVNPSKTQPTALGVASRDTRMVGAGLLLTILGTLTGLPDSPRAVGIAHTPVTLAQDGGRSVTVSLSIWYPGREPARPNQWATVDAPPAEGSFRPIIYSHGGCGGDPKSIGPLAIRLAGAGFAFIQFPHPGSSSGNCAADGPEWVKGLLQRPKDVELVLDELGRLNGDQHSPLKGKLDTTRVGLVGHSQGGHVAFLLPVEDPRIKAAVAISPSLGHPDTPRAVWDAAAKDHCPTLIVYGEKDSSWPVDGARRAFEVLPADDPHAFVRLAAMGHTPSAADLDLLEQYVAAWFARYLAEDESAAGLLSPANAPPGAAVESVDVR